MEKVRCKVCQKKFEKRKVNQVFCGSYCRRKIENRRKSWDAKREFLTRVESFAVDPKLSRTAREHWYIVAEVIQKKLGRKTVRLKNHIQASKQQVLG